MVGADEGRFGAAVASGFVQHVPIYELVNSQVFNMML
jgi:hypothetical protein